MCWGGGTCHPLPLTCFLLFLFIPFPLTRFLLLFLSSLPHLPLFNTSLHIESPHSKSHKTSKSEKKFVIYCLLSPHCLLLASLSSQSFLLSQEPHNHKPPSLLSFDPSPNIFIQLLIQLFIQDPIQPNTQKGIRKRKQTQRSTLARYHSNQSINLSTYPIHEFSITTNPFNPTCTYPNSNIPSTMYLDRIGYDGTVSLI